LKNFGFKIKGAQKRYPAYFRTVAEPTMISAFGLSTACQCDVIHSNFAFRVDRLSVDPSFDVECISLRGGSRSCRMGSMWQVVHMENVGQRLI